MTLGGMVENDFDAATIKCKSCVHTYDVARAETHCVHVRVFLNVRSQLQTERINGVDYERR